MSLIPTSVLGILSPPVRNWCSSSHLSVFLQNRLSTRSSLLLIPPFRCSLSVLYLPPSLFFPFSPRLSHTESSLLWWVSLKRRWNFSAEDLKRYTLDFLILCLFYYCHISFLSTVLYFSPNLSSHSSSRLSSVPSLRFLPLTFDDRGRVTHVLSVFYGAPFLYFRLGGWNWWSDLS